MNIRYPLLYLTLFTLLGSGSLFGQELTTVAGQKQNIDQLLQLSPVSVGGLGFDNRYKGVKGSPMRFEEWQEGSITNRSGKTVQTSDINVDLISHNLIVQKEKNKLYTVSPQEIQQITFQSKPDNILMLVLPPTAFDKPKVDKLGFYEVLFDNDLQFLKHTEKYLQKADFEKPYSTGRQYDEYSGRDYYFVKTENDEHYKTIKLAPNVFWKELNFPKSDVKTVLDQFQVDARDEQSFLLVLKRLLAEKSDS